MNLVIKLWDQEVTISLVEKRKVQDVAVFGLDRDLSDKLLPEIDKLLKKNKLDVRDVAKVRFITNIKHSYTSVRIAQAVVKAINWAKKYKTVQY
jgi:tRNA A37 threonylcarbamoyladenosine modification protein TsaB